MRILYLTDIDLGIANGPAAHVAGFTGAARRLGHDVRLFCPPPTGPLPEGLRVEALPLPAIPKLIRPLFALLSARLIRRRLGVWRPDLVYCRVSHWTHAAVPLKKALGVPLISEVNGITEDHLRGARRSALVRRMVLHHEQACLSQSDRIVAVTEGIRQHLLSRNRKLSESITVTVPNGVDPEQFRPQSAERIRAELGIPPGAFVVGYSGTLDWWQGVDILLEAFQEAAGQNPQIRLLLAGRGDDSALRKIAGEALWRERIHRTGAFPWEKAPDLIAACDICVAPKRPLASGYSPIKLYEYLACARPVVASRVEGLLLLEDIQAGLLVPPEEPEPLAQALLTLAADAQRCRSMGERGRAHVCGHCTWESVVARALDGFA